MTYDELRFVGLDDTILPEEVAQFVASEGKCEEEDIKIGQIKSMRNGLNTFGPGALFRRPRLSRLKRGMGWTYVKVELLRARPMQCYKCWSFGHVRYSCTSIIDRSRSCFNCGGEGHALRDCHFPSRCVVCEAEGKSGDHRMGSALCDTNKKPGKARSNAPGRAVTERRAGKTTKSE